MKLISCILLLSILTTACVSKAVHEKVLEQNASLLKEIEKYSAADAAKVLNEELLQEARDGEKRAKERVETIEQNVEKITQAATMKVTKLEEELTKTKKELEDCKQGN
ncbi:MAG: hypothetical protein MK212_09170 [Saprospiraceae bacterium]|nr:hypothetical protein [Saprospiraceae bacterium]